MRLNYILAATPLLMMLQLTCKEDGPFAPGQKTYLPEVPSLTVSDTSRTGNHIVRWTRSTRAKSYILQEDQEPTFSNPTQPYAGIDTTVRISGKPFGRTFYYRVRASNDEGSSNWSSTKPVVVVQLPAPQLGVDRTAIYFGNVLTGESSSQRLTVSNTGDALLSVESVASSSAAFGVTGVVPFALPPSANDTLTVTFMPVVDGQAQGDLTISGNDLDDYPVRVTVSGNAIRRAVLQIPSSIDFGQVVVDSFMLKTVWAKNIGNSDLLVESIASSNPAYSVQTDLPVGIARGDSSGVDIRYLPLTRGYHTGLLSVYCSDTLAPTVKVNLTGQGIGPAIDVQPSSVVFGDILVWSTATRALLIRNPGERVLNVFDISTSAPPFYATGIPEGSILPNASDSVFVSFVPTTEGSHTSTVVIRSNDKSRDPLTVVCSGYGGRPRVGVFPAQLSFGLVQVAQTSTLAFTIQNTGRAPLTVYSVVSDSPSFFTDFREQLILPPKSQATYQATFAPYRLDEQEGRLLVTSNDSTALRLSIPVSGYGEIGISIEDRLPMATGRSLYASAVIGTKIFIAGGFSYESNQTFSSLEIYDTLTGAWRFGAPLDTARNSAGGAAVGNKFYVLGGTVGGGGVFFATTRIYDPSTDTWASGPPMPTPRHSFATAVANGKIYTFGGASAVNIMPDVEEFDPSSNIWTKKAPLPTTRWLSQAEELNGKIYVVGGSVLGVGAASVVEIYDPGSNSWSTGSPLPKGLWGLALAKVHGRLYAIGGMQNVYTDSRAIFEFNPQTGSWVKRGDLSSAKIYANGCAVGNKIFVAGGFCCGGQQLDTNVMITVLP